MTRLPFLAAALLLSSSALAQEPDWSRAQPVTVTLSSFAFVPAKVHLHAGEPVVLRLVNAGSGGHNFSAPEFFTAAAVRAQDKGLIAKGTVEVGGHQSRDIALVPRAGTYKLRCTHMMHSSFGMKGEITVD